MEQDRKTTRFVFPLDRASMRHAPLTRRRSEHHRHCWHVYYGDVHVGTIAERTGNPHDTHPWEWSCGFYPGSHPREHQSDTAATFEQARADFERAWLVFLSKRTEADFQAWREQRDWTERKYALWDAGKRLEPTASKGTAREQAMKKISENPRFKEAPSSGTGYVIGGHKTPNRARPRVES
jgi:hypothetical protein